MLHNPSFKTLLHKTVSLAHNISDILSLINLYVPDRRSRGGQEEREEEGRERKEGEDKGKIWEKMIWGKDDHTGSAHYGD